MFFCCKVPSSYDSGILYFPEVGFAVSLHGMGSINFCGLHRHGGRPPAPKRSEDEVANWPYRLVVVHYPHANPLDGASVFPVLPFPTGGNGTSQVLAIRPDLQMLRYVPFLSFS